MKTDRLYTLLEEEIFNSDSEVDPIEMVKATAIRYVQELSYLGHIPIHMEQTLLKDLFREALEMYRKKTYGYLTLKDFKNSKKI